MKVLIARTSGFCDGVRRAMRIALEGAARHGGLDADGPLVHNDQALELLALHGIAATSDPGTSGKPLLIRAHGIPPERRGEWERAGLELVDATCVHVARNQSLARSAAERGLTVVLAGDPDHAEVKAVAASAGPACRVVSSPEDVEALTIKGGVFFLAQTTFDVQIFRCMAEVMRRRFPDCEAVDSICRATHDRQEETGCLARRADVLVVVGGRHSANTRRLAEAGRAAGKPVFLVETAVELREEAFAAFRVAAVTSGASTPGWVTQEVVNRLRRMGPATPSTIARRLLHLLMESRIGTALSAGGLALAAEFFLTGIQPALALAGAGYVFFAHTLNRRIPPNPEARRLAPVDAFYQSRRPRLLAMAWIAAGLALALAAGEGAMAFALFALAILTTSLYALPPGRTPDWLARLRAWRRGKSRSNPRNWAMAVGWSLILAGPPAWEAGLPASGIGTMLFVFCLCLGGTLTRDLHDIASDRLMGIETLASRIGPFRAKRLAARAFGGAALLPFAALAAMAWHGGGLSAGFLFAVLAPTVPALGHRLLELVEQRRISDAILLQAGVDGLGCLAGLFALTLAPFQTGWL